MTTTNWAAARRNATRRKLTRESRADAAANTEGSTTGLPFPAAGTAQHDREQARFRKIAEAHTETNRFCASVLTQIHAGRPITPSQARVLLAIEADHPQPPTSRRDTATRPAAETVTCPTCHAHPGQPCHGRSGPRNSHHLERHHTYLNPPS